MAKENKVVSINGKTIDIKADSICVHGDNGAAIELVKKIRASLAAEGIAVQNFQAQ